AFGSLLAAWFTSESIAIMGVTMSICAIACTGTSLTRWLAGYRELARLDGLAKLDLGKSRVGELDLVVAPVAVKSKLRESAELATR
ncbi:MAG TPA: hypothetical protein VK427_18115, partial [Kofleriaceae bacterium]|nr:hypothetical protein [Kofleriaceae bacterium]